MSDAQNKPEALRAIPQTGIDALAALASSHAVSNGPQSDRVLQEAVFVGQARARSRERRGTLLRGAGIACGAAAMIAAAAYGISSRPVVRVDVALTHLSSRLDRVSIESGARLSALQSVGWNLSNGAALFDVAREAAANGYEVRTPHARVLVRGTVFAVRVADKRTRIHVFEGRVLVRDAHGEHFLAAGDSYGGAREDVVSTALAKAGDRAAMERANGWSARQVVASGANQVGVGEASEPVNVQPPARALAADALPTKVVRSATPADSSLIELDEARALFDRARFADVLVAVELRMRAGLAAQPRAEWNLLGGDAARARGDHAQAADYYARAIDDFGPTRAATIGYAAAVEHQRAGNRTAAIEILDRTGAPTTGAPLEERSLLLRATLLHEAARPAEALEVERAYLARFPGGSGVDAILARHRQLTEHR